MENIKSDGLNETEDKREEIKQKLRQYYDGRIVRKDLTKSIREGANVPVYVLEYLLGQYCKADWAGRIYQYRQAVYYSMFFWVLCRRICKKEQI